MPRTVDHLVETHKLAASRRAAGLPIWAHRLNVSDIFHNEMLTFEQRRDRIAQRLQATKWYKDSEPGDAIYELTQELADSIDAEEFDATWDAIYDEADYDRVWIRTT